MADPLKDPSIDATSFAAGRQSAQFEALLHEFSEFKTEVRSSLHGMQASLNELSTQTSEMRPLARIFWALITGMLLSLIASGLSLALNFKR